MILYLISFFPVAIILLNLKTGILFISTLIFISNLCYSQKDTLISIPLDSIKVQSDRLNLFQNGIKIQKISEKSLQFDAALEWSNEHMSVAGNVFYNTVNDYIFYQKLTAKSGGDSIIVENGDDLYAFAFKQKDAHLYGAELNVDFHPHPLDWLHVENSVSLIRGQFKEALDGSTNLPGIPSARWLTEIRIEMFKKSKAIRNSFINFQLDNVFAQNNPFVGYNTETVTSAYTLLNIGFSTQVQRKNKTLFNVSLVGQNMADVAYQNHLNRLKYGPTNEATGRMGVFNMGRNFSLKINVPLQFD